MMMGLKCAVVVADSTELWWEDLSLMCVRCLRVIVYEVVSGLFCPGQSWDCVVRFLYIGPEPMRKELDRVDRSARRMSAFVVIKDGGCELK